jgi:N6-L-threonylcarbamoyladenine synthase
VILAIESSCDESALATFDASRGLTGEWVHSQIALHEAYGGVVPDLASREHLTTFPHLLDRVQAEVGLGSISEVVVTRGPGLAGCLALGVALAKALAMALRVPLRGFNHLRAHAWSPFIPLHAANPKGFEEVRLECLPHLGLLVSGGNTVLFEIAEDMSLRVLCETSDDAAGEALDKGAKLLGLPYPGGPQVEHLARQGDPSRHDFPRTGRGQKISGKNLTPFSFSGLKTSLRYRVGPMSDAELEAGLEDLCASYQDAVLDQLLDRLDQAVHRHPRGYASTGLSGGVSNNRVLRERFAAFARTQGLRALLAEPRHTGDNAGMIAFGAWVETPSGWDQSRGIEPVTIAPALRLA